MKPVRDAAKAALLRVPPVRRWVYERAELRATADSLARLVAERDEALASQRATVRDLELELRRASGFTAERAAGEAPEPPPLSQDHVRAAKLFANRRVALGFLPQGRRVAEVGVAFGDFSEVLLAELRPAVLHAYDRFAWDDSEIVWGRPAGETLAGKTHRAFYEERFAEEIAAGVVALHEGDSREQLERAPDGFYDVIYIDAGRGYDAVKADAEVATRKLREAGHLVFNDYTMFDHIHGERYGVVPVVNELCVNDGWTVAYFALHPQMYCDICIRRVSGLLAP